jgi:hypothetical protein
MLMKTIGKRYSIYLARLLAITLPALLLVSVISVSCGQTQGNTLILNSCVEHSMHTTMAFHGDLLKNVTTDVSIPFIIFLLAGWIGMKVIGKRLPSAVLFRIKFLSWLWSKRRPFSTSKPYIPVFIATRDA